jgi:peptidoglycan/xylan/chitin deacetylase (PgdA/CDA1 family)
MRIRASAVLASAALVLGLVAVAPVSWAAVEPGQTVVTLTFDDAVDTQATAVSIMDTHGLKGTIYANSAYVGAPGYMTVDQLRSAAQSGHEIGGHTATHRSLIGLTPDEARRQVCQDRSTLLGWGLPVTSFAYPFADANAEVAGIVQECGYNTGRVVGDLWSVGSCRGCDAAESLPLSNPFLVRTPDEVDSTWTLRYFQRIVSHAQANGGGWVPFVFHRICDCGANSITPELLESVASWLSGQVATGAVVVQTAAEVAGGTVQSAVGPPVRGSGEPGENLVANPSLAVAGSGGTEASQCWTATGYGANDARHERISPGRTGDEAHKITITQRTDGDAKLVQSWDLGDCALPVIEGRSYSVGAWYTSTSEVFITVYRRNSVGNWSYWTQSPRFDPAVDWTELAWRTPTVPADVTAVSFGVTLDSVGTLITDDYRFVDEPAPQAPTAMENGSLEGQWRSGIPECWFRGGYGDNDATWARVAGAGGGAAQQVQISRHVNGDAKLMPAFDGACAPTVTEGHRYRLEVTYTSTAPVFFTAHVDALPGATGWPYWTNSARVPASSGYTQATWETPPVPAGVTRLSFGLTLDAVGTLVTDDYRLVDLGPADVS